MRPLALVIAVAVAPALSVAAEFHAVQFRAYSGQFQLFLDLDASGSVSRSGPVFSPAGGIFGATFVGEVFHGAEYDNASGHYFLSTIPHVGNATGARVGATPIGFPNVEALAWYPAGQKLYGASFVFGMHVTTLIEIDPATGVGASIGELPFDVWIVGMACAPDGTLYGVTAPFGANPFFAVPRLYTIDRATGAATHVGPLGTAKPLQSLEWDYTGNRLVGAFEQLHSVNTSTGEATLIGGNFTTAANGDGIYALGAIPGDPPPPPEEVVEAWIFR